MYCASPAGHQALCFSWKRLTFFLGFGQQSLLRGKRQARVAYVIPLFLWSETISTFL